METQEILIGQVIPLFSISLLAGKLKGINAIVNESTSREIVKLLTWKRSLSRGEMAVNPTIPIPDPIC
jgi:hypothetical protein